MVSSLLAKSHRVLQRIAAALARLTPKKVISAVPEALKALCVFQSRPSTP